MPTLTPRGSGLPAIDIYRECETGFSEAEFKLKSEAIGQIKNAELLRGRLIELATVRAENKIGLAELEGKALDLDVANQRNQTKKAKFSVALQETSLELLKADELAIRAGIQATKTQGLSLELGYEKQALGQTKKRLELALEKGQLALEQSAQENSDAKALLAKRFSHTTVDIPAVRIA